MPETPADQLREVAKVWRHNRDLYPGWLIAPQPVRERLWFNTKNWIAPCVAHQESLPPAERLGVLFELNWRLETALLPVWSDLLPAYTGTLGRINPFPSTIGDLPDALLTPSSPDGAGLNWAQMRERWLSIAFGLLRHFREERQAEGFTLWHSRLGRVPDLSPDDKARWCYEQCLYALGEMDDAAVVAALDEWPAGTRDGAWAVRRAGIMAEVGRVEDAAHLLGAELRGRRCGAGSLPDIPGQSREGWLRWLEFVTRRAARVRRVRGAWHTRADEAERAALRRLYHRLGRHAADPEDLTDALAVRLAAPPPTPRPAATLRYGFAVGSARRTTTGGDSLGERLHPAYQFMRLSEETGTPPQLDDFILHEGHLKAAADWCRETDPVRTQSLMFRLLDDKVIDAYLSRHRVAALPAATVARWRECGVRAARHALEGAGGRRSVERLRAALMVAGRCAIRAEPAELDGLWDLTQAVYRSEFARGQLTVDSALAGTLNSLLDVTPADDLRRRLSGLCALPIPGEAGFELGRAGRWPDPAEEVAERLADSATVVVRDGWADLVDRQLDALGRASHPRTRKAAFWRVYQLDRLGLLTEGQRTRLAAKFWRTVGAGPGLPWEEWGPGAGHLALALPTPEGPPAAERVRQHVLGKTLGPVHGGWTSEDAYFDLIITATRPRGRRPGSARLQYIDWSPKDLGSLFQIVRAWWDDHGRRAAGGRDRLHFGWFGDPTAFDRFLGGMWDVLGRVIIPRLRTGNALARAVQAFVREVGSADLPNAAVLPATLRLQGRSPERVVSALRRALAHSRDDYYLSALRGVVAWADALAEPRRPASLPELPADLLREVAGAVAHRRPGGLRLALDASLAVLRRLGAAADQGFRETLVVGLDYLSTEAEYRVVDDPTGRVPYDEVPTIRRHAVRLACRLAEAGHGSDPVVRGWLDAGRADSLPEIRRAVGEWTLGVAPDDE